MMLEGWIALAIVASLAVLGLGSLVELCFNQARTITDRREQQRLILRDNFNVLIMTMTHEDDESSLEQMRQAFATSLGAYRSL